MKYSRFHDKTKSLQVENPNADNKRPCKNFEIHWKLVEFDTI
jgi:hypothetical protein